VATGPTTSTLGWILRRCPLGKCNLRPGTKAGGVARIKGFLPQSAHYVDRIELLQSLSELAVGEPGGRGSWV
jgi:hypothetical protein